MKKITFANKLGYMLGDVANNMSFAMSSSFLLAFYTDVAGISAAAAGVLFLVARFGTRLMTRSWASLPTGCLRAVCGVSEEHRRTNSVRFCCKAPGS